MGRTRIKVCGITRPEDAIGVAELGVDAIGLVFYPPSPRCVDVDRAREIVNVLPPFVDAVGLFLDEERHRIEAVLDALPLELLQFHGGESPAECAVYDRPYIKAIPMGEAVEPQSYARDFTGARGFLLDSNPAGAAGGTGKRFDWTRSPRDLGRPLILAGGLDPSNVSVGVAQVNPYAVDVSSGVESSSGIKDMGLVEAFIRGVRRGESR